MRKDGVTREEEALLEMADTRITRATAWFLVGSFLGLLLVVPLWQGLRAAPTGGTRPDLTTLLPNQERFLPTPAELRTFEDDLEEASFLRSALLSPVQALLCRIGAGNEQAYPGRDGWLYFRRDVEHVTGPGFLEPAVQAKRRRLGDESTAPPEPDSIGALIHFADQLAQRGIELIVVPTPVKPTVDPQHLGANGDRWGFDNPSMHEFEVRLAEAGIRFLSLPSVFASAGGDEPLYLATDTHWTPKTMGLAAAAIADEVRPLLPLDDAQSGLERFVRRELTVSNLGDITRMLQLADPEPLFPEEVAVIRPVAELQNGGPLAEPRVLFLGDSFANIYSLGPMGWGQDAGLVEQLQFELQEPVEALRINDNGSFATRQALRRKLSQGTDLLAGKHVVVYQFAARELSQGDWKRIELPNPEGRAPPTNAQAGRVTGILRAIAPVPRPGTVPYKDAVTCLHLTEVRGEPPISRNEIVVLRWGMRDGVWTSTTRLRPGEELTLDVVPWASVSADYDSFNRSELAEEALWDLPTYWAPLEELEATPPEASIPPPETGVTESKPAPGVGLEALLTLAQNEVHVGQGGWLFFGPELRHLASGPYWGEAAQTAARASDPGLRDPLPAILDFHTQLADAGIELWVIPVPPKAAIYPENLGLAGAGLTSEVLVLEDRRFLSLLDDEGVHTLDLFGLFRSEKESGPPLYCLQDTHWSPHACETVAERIVTAIGKERFDNVPRRGLKRERHSVEIQGDLWRSLKQPDLEPETLELHVVQDVVQDEGSALPPWRESPVLLLGDSHTLVFHAGGDLLAKGAGLPEQLAYALGFPVDVVGVRGSGSTAARISLLRRRDNLAGKRVVLWVFAAREFTQSTDGWRKVPVIR